MENIKQGKEVEILATRAYTILNPMFKQNLNEKVTFEQGSGELWIFGEVLWR